MTIIQHPATSIKHPASSIQHQASSIQHPVKLYFTNYPKYVPNSVYESAIQKVVDALRCQPGCVSIYQIGSTATPGISDIDILAVFEDGVRCNMNPLLSLPKKEKYLFTHSLFGCSRKYFHEAQKYTFFNNYKLLWGEQLPVGSKGLKTEEVEALKIQIALEFLLMNYIARTVELTYRIASVRGLLLSVKALRFDLEFLNISDGPFKESVDTCIDWRKSWFQEPEYKENLNDWFLQFYRHLESFFNLILQKHDFYIPAWANLRYARHVCLEPADTLKVTYRGFRLLPQFAWMGKKYFRLQHRFNDFSFEFPFTKHSPVAVLEDRFLFLKSLKNYNREFLFYLSPVTANFGNNVV